MVYLIVIYPVQVYAFEFQTFPMITDGTVSVHACCTYIHTYMYYYLSYESVFVVSYICDFLMDRLNCKYAHTRTHAHHINLATFSGILTFIFVH